MRNQRDNRQEEFSNNTVNPQLPAGSRGIPVARQVEGISEFGYPVLQEIGDVRRNFVRANGAGGNAGAWSYAMPGIIEGSDDDPTLHVMDNDGRVDSNFIAFDRWQLPDTSKDIAPGTTGVIVAGTDLDDDRVIFHPDTNLGLRVNHHGPARPAGESTVWGTDALGDIDGNGGLSTAFYVFELPPQFGGGYAIALNAMSLEDKNLDGNMAFVFNDAPKYANALGNRGIGLGTWNRNGPFAFDPTTQTEMGRNALGEPLRAMIMDYRTAKFGNPEQNLDAPAPLDFDDSRYAHDSTRAGISLERISQGLQLNLPFFGKGKFFLNPNRMQTVYDADGNPYLAPGVWEIEVEEHIISPETSANTPNGQVHKDDPANGGGGGGAPPPGAPPPPGGGGGGGGGGGAPPPPGAPPRGQPKGKPQGDVKKKEPGAEKRKCKQKANRAGDGGNGKPQQPPRPAPKPPGVPQSVWDRIQRIIDGLKKATRKGQARRKRILEKALEAERKRAERYAERARRRAAQLERIRKYGTTNRDGQARIAGRRAVAREAARRRKACEPRQTPAEKRALRERAKKQAAKIIAAGGVPGSSIGSPTTGQPQKDQGAKGSKAGGNDTDKEEELLEKEKDKIQKEIDAEEKALKEAIERARGSKKRELKRRLKKLKERRDALEDADWEDVRRDRSVHGNRERKPKGNQGVEKPVTGERAERDSQERKAAPKSMILPGVTFDKIMQPGIDLYAPPELLRRENAMAAGDTRTIDEYIGLGKAPIAICITPVAGLEIEPRNIKNLAKISSTVFHAPDVDPTDLTSGSAVESAVVLRPETPLYIAAYPQEGVDADNNGAAVDGWKLSRDVDVEGNQTLKIDCIDSSGNHDPNKSITLANKTFDQNGDEITFATGTDPNDADARPRWFKLTVTANDFLGSVGTKAHIKISPTSITGKAVIHQTEKDVAEVFDTSVPSWTKAEITIGRDVGGTFEGRYSSPQDALTLTDEDYSINEKMTTDSVYLQLEVGPDNAVEDIGTGEVDIYLLMSKK